MAPFTARDRVRPCEIARTARAGAVSVGADVGLRGDVAQRVVGDRNARTARTLARGSDRRGRHAVQRVVLEGLLDGLDAVGARQQVAQRVELVAQILDRARRGTGGHNPGQMPGGGVVGVGQAHAVAVGGAGHIAAPIHAHCRPVGGARRGVGELGELAVGGVGRLDGQARRIGDGRGPAVAVVGRGDGIVRAVVHGLGLGRGPAQAVVGERRAIAVARLARKLADALGRRVVDPARDLRACPRGAVGAGQHAAQHVVAQARGLALGVRLAYEPAKRVVAVSPAALVGIAHGDLVAADVVGHRGEVARRVGDLEGLADGVVKVGQRLAVGVGGNRHLAHRVRGDGLGLAEPVGGGDGKPVIGHALGLVVGLGGGPGPAKEIVLNGGPIFGGALDRGLGLLDHVALAVIDGVPIDEAAVEAFLRLPHGAVQNVLEDRRGRSAIGHAHERVSGVGRAHRGPVRAIIAIGRGLGAVRAQLLRDLAPSVIGPLRGKPVRPRRGQRQAVHGIVGGGLGLAQRISFREMIADVRIVGVARGPARYRRARRRGHAAVRGPAFGHARHRAEAVAHIGFGGRKRVPRLDGLAEEQPGVGIVSEARIADEVRRTRRDMRDACRIGQPGSNRPYRAYSCWWWSWCSCSSQAWL